MQNIADLLIRITRLFLWISFLPLPLRASEIGWTHYFNQSTFAQCLGLQAKSWINSGYTFNPSKPYDRYNGPVTFNDRDREVLLNQVYVFLERAVDKTHNNWSIGGRVDLLYGSDAGFTQTFGSTNSHWDLRLTNQRFNNLALPQAYVELYAPLWTGIDIKLGHFYTLLGSESVMAPDNFFYSHSYTEQFGEPFTHSGLLVEFPIKSKLNPTKWTLRLKLGAITGGENGGWDAGFDDGLGAWRFLGSLSMQAPDHNQSLDISAVSGEESEHNSAHWNLYSIVYKNRFFQGYEYNFQFDHGWVEASSNRTEASWYGIVNGVTFPLTEALSAGIRAEWFFDAHDFRVQYPARLGIKLPESGHFVAAVLGLKWQADTQLTFRPSLRYDWSPNTRPFDGASSHQQWLLSMDMILTI